ncbi:ATP-dependent DNA ligase [Streptomyces lavendulae]
MTPRGSVYVGGSRCTVQHRGHSKHGYCPAQGRPLSRQGRLRERLNPGTCTSNSANPKTTREFRAFELQDCANPRAFAFDLLQQDGQELLARPYDERRAQLENLFSEHALTAPWTLVPQTTDLAKAREWLESWTDVSGVEGILVKPLNGRYQAGYRGWTKIRRRDTAEAIVGAITGTLARPQLLVLGRHDTDGRLRPVGRTVPLRPDAARQVAEHLTPAAPGHPWTGARFSATWGSRDVLDTTLVHPALVAEVSADRAIDHGGVYRHPLRFQRLRLDIEVQDVPRFGQGSAAAG